MVNTTATPKASGFFMSIIVANGHIVPGLAIDRLLATVSNSSLIIGVDGGTDNALKLGLKPSLVVGDMDSIHPNTLQKLSSNGVEIHRYPPAKNETDLELALVEAVQRKVQSIRIIGAIGNRLDQTLANTYLLALPKLAGIDTRLVAGKQTIWLIHPGTHRLMGDIGDTISLIPLTMNVEGIQTTGLEYPLKNESLYFGPARGISNVIAANYPQVTFTHGMLLVVHTIGHA